MTVSKQAGRNPFHNSDVKGIEFDAFRKSAPLTRHDGRGVMAMRTMGAKQSKGRDKARRDWMGTDETARGNGAGNRRKDTKPHWIRSRRGSNLTGPRPDPMTTRADRGSIARQS